MKKILNIFIVFIFLGSFTSVYASEESSNNIGAEEQEILKTADVGLSIKSAEGIAQGVRNGNEGQGFTEVVNTILGFIQIMSGLLSVVIIAVTGFRYITETPDMKSEIKKSMVPIIVGMLLVFFAVTIAKFLIGVFETNMPNGPDE